jgi:hypothetical protein
MSGQNVELRREMVRRRLAARKSTARPVADEGGFSWLIYVGGIVAGICALSLVL